MTDSARSSAPVPRPAVPYSRVSASFRRKSSSTAWRALLVLLYFGAASSFAGGCLGAIADGGPIPLAYLADTPFTSYLIPGLLLGVVVGGTQLAGAIALQRGNAASLLWCAVAGFGMMVWIFIEIAMIRQYSFLQSIYFGLGVLELALVLALLGIAPAVVARRLPSRTGTGRQ
ncbi:hypothetical protein [Subtercola vilae]|uniref:hypothetical protein n=1 Tax=Subtercola vilae TaxID=2056433 RepID=UPI0010AA9BF5|nr:hypothetical protein [Subtercola vilae]